MSFYEWIFGTLEQRKRKKQLDLQRKANQRLRTAAGKAKKNVETIPTTPDIFMKVIGKGPTLTETYSPERGKQKKLDSFKLLDVDGLFNAIQAGLKDVQRDSALRAVALKRLKILRSKLNSPDWFAEKSSRDPILRRIDIQIRKLS
tara:strand:- start:543 stop:980 length:438 start_codon:yes stop_codon:yes gene_type:complete